MTRYGAPRAQKWGQSAETSDDGERKWQLVRRWDSGSKKTQNRNETPGSERGSERRCPTFTKWRLEDDQPWRRSRRRLADMSSSPTEAEQGQRGGPRLYRGGQAAGPDVCRMGRYASADRQTRTGLELTAGLGGVETTRAYPRRVQAQLSQRPSTTTSSACEDKGSRSRKGSERGGGAGGRLDPPGRSPSGSREEGGHHHATSKIIES